MKAKHAPRKSSFEVNPRPTRENDAWDTRLFAGWGRLAIEEVELPFKQRSDKKPALQETGRRAEIC
jgi:hypothetical protein